MKSTGSILFVLFLFAAASLIPAGCKKEEEPAEAPPEVVPAARKTAEKPAAEPKPAQQTDPNSSVVKPAPATKPAEKQAGMSEPKQLVDIAVGPSIISDPDGSGKVLLTAKSKISGKFIFIIRFLGNSRDNQAQYGKEIKGFSPVSKEVELKAGKSTRVEIGFTVPPEDFSYEFDIQPVKSPAKKK